MSEAATANRRGFLSSFQYVTLIGGHVLAQLTLLIALQFLDGDALRAWGWRIGFFIGGIAALVVLWCSGVRRRCFTKRPSPITSPCSIASRGAPGPCPLLRAEQTPRELQGRSVLDVAAVLVAQLCTPVKQLRYSLGVVRSPRTKWCR
jgi:MFS family permease